MENFKQSNIKLADITDKKPIYKTPGWEETQKLIDQINYFFLEEQKNFVHICYYISELSNMFNRYDVSYYKRYFDKTGNQVFEETVYESFGLTGKEVKRLINIRQRFIETVRLVDDIVPKLKSEFLGYSKSKLIEMLPLSNEQIKVAFLDGKITINSTCLEIRDYIKSLKNSKPKADKVLEESQSKDPEPFTGLYVTFEDECNERIKKVVQSGKFATPSEYINHLIKIDIKASNLSST